MTRHNKPKPDIGFWTERDLRQARDWKRSGFSLVEIATALKRNLNDVQMKWEIDAFALEIKPKKERNCLSCSIVFLSEGKHNRLCDRCRERLTTFVSVTEEF